MSAPAQEPVPVNVLAVAQRVLGSPTGMEQTTELELVALAAFVVQANELPIEWPNWPLYGRAIKASLAASLASAVRAHDAVYAASKVKAQRSVQLAALDEFSSAFNTLKTRFNQEFPTDGNR